MNKLWWVIIGLVAVIVLLILFQPTRQPSLEKIKALIARRDQENARLKEKHEKDSAYFAHKVAQLRDSLKNEHRHTVKLERSIAKIKANPIIIKVRDSIKVVDDAFITYDSTLAAKNEEIRIQGKMIVSLEDENARITDNFLQRLKLADENFEAQKQISETLAKDLKKERRKFKAAKILIPIVGVGMFLLGSQ